MTYCPSDLASSILSHSQSDVYMESLEKIFLSSYEISYEPSLYGTKGTESDEDVAVWRLPVHENRIERMYTNEQRTRNEKLFAPRGESVRTTLAKKIGTSRPRITARVMTLS
ncbi:hypothetical protein WN48_08245 [Eufriesea mexicana]|nr:hypothetical protein WN48_08245 [Eufriesea mexicana]